MHFTYCDCHKCKFRSTFDVNEPNSFKLPYINFESIVKSGISLKNHDFSKSTSVRNRGKKSVKNCETNSCLRIRDIYYYYLQEFPNTTQLTYFFPEIRIFDQVTLKTSETGSNTNKNNFYTKPCLNSEDNAIFSQNDIFKLFDLLEIKLDELNIISLKPIMRDSKTSLRSESGKFKYIFDAFDWRNCLIKEINDFFIFQKSSRYGEISNKANFLKYLKEKMGWVYFYLNRHRILEYLTQFSRLLLILIILGSSEQLKDKIMSILILICICINIFFTSLDITFQLLNWDLSCLMNVTLDIIFVIYSLEYLFPIYKMKRLKNIIGLSLFYTLIFRIVFIHQCRYYNKYFKFQVLEVVRSQLKKVFFELDHDMDSKISYSQFEYFCVKFGIDINQKCLFTSNTLENYLFQNNRPKLVWNYISLKKQLFFLVRRIKQFSFCKVYSENQIFEIFIKISKVSILSYLWKNFTFSSTLHICNISIQKFVEIIEKYLDNFNGNVPEQDSVSSDHRSHFFGNNSYSNNINYVDFENLIISVDTKKEIFKIIASNTKLFDLIDGPYLFFPRKIWFERLLFLFIISLCILIPLLLLVLSLTLEKSNESIDILSQNKLIISMVTSFLYLILIFFTTILHRQIDYLFYSIESTSYEEILHKYDKIYGTEQKYFRKNHFLELEYFRERTFSMSNNFLLEFLSIQLLTILENNLNSFSKYLPQQVAKSLLKSCKCLSPYAQYKEITILFSDIVGFTNIAEKISPFKLFELLTEYFDEMVTIIEEYKGTLLEIVGDAILVIWNSPNIVENHSVAAINASLKMKNLLKLKSRSFHNICLSQINIRCGIHTDNVLIGNIGGNKRMKYGILGDGVNLASRIESLTKRYCADIIISNNVFFNRQVQEKFVICPLDVVIVQGKTKPTVLYHVLNTILNSDSISIIKSKLHTKALLFFLNKKFSNSLRYIGKINELHSNKKDPTMTILASKCKHFQKRDPGIDWSYAEMLNSKIF